MADPARKQKVPQGARYNGSAKFNEEPWYFGKIDRNEAEKKLRLPENGHGAFLIRNSVSSPNNYALSVRNGDTVMHRLIREMKDGGFYISLYGVPFSTLQGLVEHYRKSPNELDIDLRNSCIQIERPANQWEIPRTSLSLVCKLGHGKFGEVWKGSLNTYPVAIKFIKPGSAMDTKDFLAEAQIMIKLRHTKLIKLLAVCTMEKPICIIMELMKNGNVRDFLQNKGRNLKLPQLIDMAAQVAFGMSYLEAQNYIHRDLAARNVLVGDNNDVKIADFGLAARLNKENKYYRARKGELFPVKWTAPEALYSYTFSIKSDVWSYGILLTELVTYGREPYLEMNISEVRQQVKDGYRMPIPSNCPQELYSIMLECWHREPMKRPTFKFLKWKLRNFYPANKSAF